MSKAILSRLNGRFAWALWHRYKMQRELLGFRASFSSNVDRESKLDTGVSLGKGVFVGKSIIEHATYVNSNTKIKNSYIGKYCSIGPEVIIGGLGMHPVDFISTHPAFYSPRGQSGVCYTEDTHFSETAKTTLGNDVWVGARAIVLDGITIGDGAIVAAGAVVTKDVAAYSIVGGVPAVNIRSRFPESIIQRLLAISWWEAEDAKLARLTSKFFQKKLEEKELDMLEEALKDSKESKKA